MIVFPEDVTFTLLPATQAKRVFLLRFKSNPARKFFFWSQEAKADNDQSICEKVLEAVNNPGTVLSSLMAARNEGGGNSSSRGGDGMMPPGATSPLGGPFSEADLQALLGAYSPQQLLSWMNSGGSRPGSAGTPFGTSSGSSSSNAAPRPNTSTTSTTSNAPTTPATTTATANGSNGGTTKRPGPAELAAALRAIGTTMQNKTSGGSGGLSIPLSEILSADAVISSATAPNAATDRLISHLPPGTGLPGDEELIASLRSPQFQQAANMLSAALETGQLGPLLIEMGVSRDAVAGVTDVESFLRALQQHAATNPPATPATNGAPVPKTPAAPKKEGERETANGTKKDQDSANNNGDGSSPMEH